MSFISANAIRISLVIFYVFIATLLIPAFIPAKAFAGDMLAQKHSSDDLGFWYLMAILSLFLSIFWGFCYVKAILKSDNRKIVAFSSLGIFLFVFFISVFFMPQLPQVLSRKLETATISLCVALYLYSMYIGERTGRVFISIVFALCLVFIAVASKAQNLPNPKFYPMPTHQLAPTFSCGKNGV